MSLILAPQSAFGENILMMLPSMNPARPEEKSKMSPLWKAVLNRDKRADGSFVYAVGSTGIYCRPSCPSRKPKRERVTFFALAEAAEQQGFRPCRRCKPSSARLPDPRIEAVARVCREIDARLAAGLEDDSAGDARLTLSALSGPAGMSIHQLERAFQNAMGITPRQYADARRMHRLKSGLKKGNNVTTALYDAGFSSSSRLYERASGHLGMTPAAYGRGGAGMRIDYVIVSSPLGRLLMGATASGISALYFGESDAALRAALQKEYPRATLSPEKDSGSLRDWVAQVLSHLRGREPSLDLPTDVRATAFQRRVWEELRKIPYGSTRSYGEIAHAIGRPRSVRAVARACATNPVSVVVPCHRVVRADGNLAGYRWGIQRKSELLAKEAAAGSEKTSG
jgi:AraC family transcriptional regulator, regulatory protein of adaptative response / methylated-DNA-[protein]-cysteine methyltransferase